MIYTTTSEAETLAVAKDFAAELGPRDIVLIRGQLGMGKSVFSRGVVRALMRDETLDVPSPTFTLVQTYNSPKGEIFHFDLYRLKDPEEVYEIGWEDALGHGIVLVEWPERLLDLTPKSAISVTLSAGNAPDTRKILIERPVL